MKYIKAIGVEVESAVDEESVTSDMVDSVKEDGSIYINDEDESVDDYYPYSALEITSRPLNSMSKVKKFFDDIAVCINPDCVNSSMGMHIHISLNKDYYYDVLYCMDFVDRFLKEFGNEIWYNRRISNTYCHPSYESLDVPNYFIPIDYRNSDSWSNYERYLPVNYISAWHKFGTFEFRLFPSDTCERMYDYVERTVKIVNKYLDGHLWELENDVRFPLMVDYEENYSRSNIILNNEPEMIII